MSSITYCDCDECSSNNQDEIIYSLSDEVKEYMKRVYRQHFITDMCEDCLNEFNEDEEIFIVAEYNELKLKESPNE